MILETFKRFVRGATIESGKAKELQTLDFVSVPDTTMEGDPAESDCSDLVASDTIALEIDRGDRGLFVYARTQDDLSVLREELLALEYIPTMVLGKLTRSRHFGYQTGQSDRPDTCGEVPLNNQRLRDALGDAAILAAEVYAKHFPEQYEQHCKEAEAIKPQWKFPYTPFTNGIINRDNALRYHRDQGNYDGALTCTINLREGAEGGFLALPALNTAIDCADSTVTVFDGARLCHGVTPIQLQHSGAYRLSVLFYTLKSLWRCE